MGSNIVAALLGGGFLLLGTVAGALLTNWQRARALAEQRAHDEILRRNEAALAEWNRFHPISKDDVPVVGDLMGRSAQVLHPSLHIGGIGNFTRPRAACFPRGTLIMMEDGSFRPIETLHEGDPIRIYRAYTHTEAEGTVSNIRIDAGNWLVTINKEIAVTPEQEVLSDGFYVPAAKLQLGATLASDNRRGLEVTSLEVTTIQEDVYSVALTEDAGYFIRSPQAKHAILVREATTGKKSMTPMETGIIAEDIG